MVEDIFCGIPVSGRFIDKDPDIYYTFTLNGYYTVTFDNCPTVFDSTLRVYNAAGHVVVIIVVVHVKMEMEIEE